MVNQKVTFYFINQKVIFYFKISTSHCTRKSEHFVSFENFQYSGQFLKNIDYYYLLCSSYVTSTLEP